MDKAWQFEKDLAEVRVFALSVGVTAAEFETILAKVRNLAARDPGWGSGERDIRMIKSIINKGRPYGGDL
ncbi:hypothetical protein BOSEA31B_13863 [Hyphomicrobiales bacterium]|nr:hypothetical protein BOSEA31B_13863 [Hyphomicrobiales bacterium]CAH1699638.1 hypothetical protein BOSEA1005_12691 [Hyphomicrobiales bacterium]CAI0343372.1 hypothetical protein BO1005MUT1_240016 [Hyphomicrobiales bacterium]